MRMIFCSMAAAVLGLGMMVMGQGVAGSGGSAKLPFTVSKETTGITGPLRADGTVDYVAALNEKYGKGVTPENNGFVKWLEVVGTGENVIPAKLKPEFLKLCGAKEMPDGAEVWEGYGLYMTHRKRTADPGPAWDEIETAARGIWRSEEHPDLAAFLKEREALLTKVAQAVTRSKWWMPRVSSDGQTVVGTLVPSLAISRDVGYTLCSRAILRGTTGDVNGFLADVATVRWLARGVGSGPTLIERLVAVALESLATNTVGVVASSGKLTEGQCQQVMKALEGFGPMPGMVESVDILERWGPLDMVQWIAIGKGDLLKESLGDVNLVDRSAVDWDVVFKTMNALFDETVKVMRAERFGDFRIANAALEERIKKLKEDPSEATLQWTKGARELPAAYTNRVASLMVSFLMPSMGKAEELYRRSVQQGQMVRVVVGAAEVKAKTGKWPGSAEEIVPGVLKEMPKDMYSEGGAMPFRYVVKGDGVRVYSVGENGKDDGGVMDREGGKDDLGVGVK
ncbi:MAG TPA: hypothetical protein VGN88_10725 [Phycisphaerae bacterium]|jgi:hypothetical protein